MLFLREEETMGLPSEYLEGYSEYDDPTDYIPRDMVVRTLGNCFETQRKDME